MRSGRRGRLVLVEEGADFPFSHALHLLREEPGHAVDEDGVGGVLANGVEVLEEVRAAQAEDGCAALNDGELVFAVDDDAGGEQLGIEGLVFVAGMDGDDVDLKAEGLPWGIW